MKYCIVTLFAIIPFLSVAQYSKKGIDVLAGLKYPTYRVLKSNTYIIIDSTKDCCLVLNSGLINKALKHIPNGDLLELEVVKQPKRNRNYLVRIYVTGKRPTWSTLKKDFIPQR